MEGIDFERLSIDDHLRNGKSLSSEKTDRSSAGKWLGQSCVCVTPGQVSDRKP